MLYNKIKKYLSDHSIEIEDVINDFELMDNSDGKGSFIKAWDIQEVAKPTQEQLNAISDNVILLQEAIDSKVLEIKNLRKTNLLSPTPKTVTYSGGLVNKTFKVSEPDVNTFNNIISYLQELIDNGTQNPTRKWTDATGERLDLSISDFKSLRNHLLYRDEQEHNQCRLRIAAVKALTIKEEVEAFDINQVIVE